MYEVESGTKKKALKVVVYGPEGVGKSTLASQFPKPLFIDTEDSTSHMDVKRLKKPSSFIELLAMVDWVKQLKPCSTLIIDTADWAQQLAEGLVKSENNWKSIESPGYGEGYVKTREKWGDLLDKLTDVVNVGINVVLTAHTEIKKFEDPTENLAYDRYELKLAKRSNAHIAGVTKEWADMVLFINYEVYAVKRDGMGNKGQAQGGQRKIFTTHHPAYDAKNRFGLPESMSLDYAGIAHVVPDLVSQAPDIPFDNVPTNQVSEPKPIESEQKEALEKAFPELPSYLPKALTDLMHANNVTEDELNAVAGVRGHFPINTDFEQISKTTPEYFLGGLVANWEPVLAVVHEIRSNPQQLVDLWRKVGEANPEERTKQMNIHFNN